MVQGGESKEFTIKVTPKDAIEGEKTLGLVVKEGSKSVSELTVNTYVEGKQQIDWINIALAVLLVIAIIILLSLVITIAKRKGEGSEGDDYSSTEEYY
jgi:ATP-dependent Zn protease